jgi:alpha-glucoside transport system substrate-binding protein
MGNSQYDGNINGFYDNLAVYNDKPGVRKLLQYLSTAQAQQIWVDAGGTLGGVKSLTYKDPIFQRAAEVANTAKSLLVTAGDFMPADMRNAFWKSLLDVTRNPSSLDSVLANLDKVQAAAYKAA